MHSKMERSTRKRQKYIASAVSFLRLVEFFHPVAVFEDFTRLGAVGRADDAVLFHQIDETRGAAITDAQSALQGGSGCATGVANYTNRVLIQIVVHVFAAVSICLVIGVRGLAAFLFRRFQQFFLVLCVRLLAPEVAHGADLILSD